MKLLKNNFKIGLILIISGCSSRVIYVPHGQPVRLAESVRARVYVPDKDGQQVKSQNRITIPEGWYALPK